MLAQLISFTLLNSHYTSLLLVVVHLAAKRYLDLLLVLRLANVELLAHLVGIHRVTEVLELVFGPDLFLHALRPRLVLVVVTYHAAS